MAVVSGTSNKQQELFWEKAGHNKYKNIEQELTGVQKLNYIFWQEYQYGGNNLKSKQHHKRMTRSNRDTETSLL
jgi:hypothetical protein